MKHMPEVLAAAGALAFAAGAQADVTHENTVKRLFGERCAKNLGKNDADRARNLATFKEWIAHWTLKRKKDISEDELKKIKAPEK